jgi:hypothetical protein
MSKLVRSSSITPGLGRVCLLLWAVSLGLGGTARAAADTPPSLGFSPLPEDDIGTAGERETRLLITSAADYERYFGHPPPEDSAIDWSRQWVVFYSAGIQPTGGYKAQIERIFVTGRVLQVVTVLVRPGDNCLVTQALTKPNVMVTFDRPTVPLRRFRFSHREEVRSCEDEGGATSACAAVLCAIGTRCQEMGGEAQCVPIARCGGKRGETCPGLGRCVDDPTDSCVLGRDPDCAGMCVCDALAKCIEGQRFDNSPEVCNCVPENQGVSCGRKTCPAGQVCCNASCGICTPPGGVCIQIECL